MFGLVVEALVDGDNDRSSEDDHEDDCNVDARDRLKVEPLAHDEPDERERDQVPQVTPPHGAEARGDRDEQDESGAIDPNGGEFSRREAGIDHQSPGDDVGRAERCRERHEDIAGAGDGRRPAWLGRAGHPGRV